LRDCALFVHRPERAVSQDDAARLFVDDGAAQRNLGADLVQVRTCDHERAGVRADRRVLYSSSTGEQHAGCSRDGACGDYPDQKNPATAASPPTPAP
jgi:hypothetical protein